MFKKIIGVLLGFILIVVFAVFYFTSGIVDTADEFFNAVKDNNMDKAYSLVSEDFKSNTSKEQLEAFLNSSSFSKFKEASWSSRSVTNNKGKLVGTITTTDNNALPISVDLIKTGDGWKILYIQKPSSGVSEKIEMAKMPSEQELIKLTTDTMHIFAQSVAEQNMKKIRDSSSSLFQKQVSLEKFNKAYGSFFKFKDKLMIIDKLNIQFSEKAKIDAEGILHIIGLYPITPNPLTFENKYVFEGYGWKLLGIKINI